MSNTTLNRTRQTAPHRLAWRSALSFSWLLHHKGGIKCLCSDAAILIALLLVAGCGTVEHKVTFDQQYSVLPGTKVVLGSVKNQTGQSFDIDVEKMLADAFSQVLKERNLQWTGGSTPKLMLAADIVEYAKGDAFKRWLMPGWGSTVLVVRGVLYESDSRKVGSVDAKRTVDAGGGYTVGAWETVFRNIAEDIVSKLAEQLK